MATRSGGIGVGWSNVLGVTWAGSTSELSDGTSVGDDSPVRSARLAACGNESEAFARLLRLNGVSCRAGDNLDGGVACLRPLTTGKPSCGSGCQRRHRDSGNCARVSDGDPKRGTLILDWLPTLSDVLMACSWYLLTPNGGAQPRREMASAAATCWASPGLVALQRFPMAQVLVTIAQCGATG